jgi:hypothetical protein
MGNTLSNIGVNTFGDPNSLTPVGLNSLYGNLTIDYTGSTIPQSTYRVYTTFNDTNFRLLNDVVLLKTPHAQPLSLKNQHFLYTKRPDGNRG